MIEDKKNKGVNSLLFELLNQKKIPYFVLRNYENLPAGPLGGTDIDLLIKNDSKEKYLSVLKKAVFESKGYIVSVINQSNCLSCFIWQKNNSIPGVWIDAFLELSTKSFVWADSNFLLQNCYENEKGFFVSSPGGEAAVLFVREILNGSSIKEKYRLRIPGLIANDKENFIKTIKPYFSNYNVEKMASICLSGKWKEAFKERNNWRRNLILNHFFKKPFHQTFRFLNFVLSQIKKNFKRIGGGSIIVIMGPDGVGKTTICEGLKEKVSNFPFNGEKQYHGHFGFFPELGKMYSLIRGRKILEQDKAAIQEKPIGFLRAILHLFYYGLECFLSWPLVFWLKIRGNLIVFDRYFYDFIATKTHREIPFWMFYAIAIIIPRPDIIFTIEARPETIYGRKKDLSLKEIKRQLEAFCDPRIAKISPVILINGEKTPDLILDDIEEEIAKKLAKKYGGK